MRIEGRDGPIRILIVEDREADAELIAFEIRKAGIEFVSQRVDTRDSFMHALEAFSPDLILADYSLPAFDGMSALAISRQTKPDLPFIFVSGAMGEERAIELLKEGATDYILKDHLSKLPSAVKRAMRELQERRVLQKYHEKLRSLTSELTLAEERERRRLATELHERIGQTLAISKLKLQVLREATAEAEANGPLKQILELIDSAIQDTRSITRELGSPILDQFGLAAAIEWLVEQMRERYAITIDFAADGEFKTPEYDFQIMLYQATRELMMNSIKHAEPGRIAVRLGMQQDMIRIQVKDDGVGFSSIPENNPGNYAEGFGLFSIRERLNHIGGRLTIESTAGRGSCITISAPRLKTTKRRRATDKLLF
jgi:signal transduction histidine kinase